MPAGQPQGATSPRLAADDFQLGGRHRRRRRGCGCDQLADLGDRGQRLAAKAERADAEQIVGVGDLAGGVAGDGQRQLVGRDAAAVIDDADQLDAPLLDSHVDPRRAGVDGVLQQLLDDAGRPLDHLAGGDLVDDARAEAGEWRRRFSDERHGSVP